MNNPLNVIISSAASGWGTRFIGVIVSLVTLPLIMAHLGKIQYGIWILVGQVIQFMSLTDLGVTNAIGRFLSRFRVQGDREGINQLVTSVAAVLICLALILVLGTVFCSPWIPILLNVENEYADVTRMVFIISGVSIALLFPVRMGQGILFGYQRYSIPNVAHILGSLLNLSGIVLLVSLDKLQVVNFALVSSISLIFGQIINIVFAFKTIRPISIKIHNFSLPILKEVFSLGSSTLTVTASAKLYRQGIAITVGLFAGTAAVGVYGVILTLMTHVSFLLTQISRPMMTLASEFQATDRIGKLCQLNNFVMKISFALGLCVVGGIFFYGEAFLRLLLSNSDWTDIDFHKSGIALTIMSAGLAVGIPQMAGRSIMQGVGQHWSVAKRFFIASIISLLVGITLMIFDFGIIAAAIGWSLIFVLQGVWLYPRLVCHFLGQNITKMIYESYLPGGAIGLLVVLAAWFFSTLMPPSGFMEFTIGVAICVITGLIGILMIEICNGNFIGFQALKNKYRTIFLKG